MNGNELLSTSELDQARDQWGPRVGLAVVGLNRGTVAGFEGRAAPYAWSTTKLLVVAQLLEDLGGPQNFTEQQLLEAELTITESDNDAAAALNATLKGRNGGAAKTAEVLTELLRRAGDTRTEVKPGSEPNSTYGLTSWRAQDQVKFFAELARGCLIDETSTAYLLTTMGRVIEEQSWGLGSVGAEAFKGGWGARTGETAFEVRQVGLMRAADGNPYVVAITAWPTQESLESGQELVDEVAQWLAGKVVTAPPPSYCDA